MKLKLLSWLALSFVFAHFSFASTFDNKNQNLLSFLDVADIPYIDLDLIAKKTGDERKLLIKEFGDGLRDVGFIAIKTSDALAALIKEVNVEIVHYFSQKLEEKENDFHDNNSQTGFSRQGSETAAGAKKPDIKETYFIPPNFQRWPKNRSNFQDVMSSYHIALTDIAAQAMGYVAEYLEEPTEDISESMACAYNLVRLAYYPAPKETDDKEAVWAAAHEDLNALTLLPPSTVPGLQLLTKDGEWKAVVVPEGYLIINTGEQLQMKTAGLIRATRHQVINPGGQYQFMDRFASIFFASWSDQFSLKPFDSCIAKMTKGLTTEEKEKYLEQFPDVTTKDNLLSRLIELQTIRCPSFELVQELRNKGLLRTPPEALIKLYPMLF